MKKAELQVGGTYAMVAPAHRDDPIGHAKKVMVLDLETGVEKHYACDSWSSSCSGARSYSDTRDKYPDGRFPNEVEVESFDGSIVTATDHTTTRSWGSRKPRGIKVLTYGGRWGDAETWDIKAAQLGQLVMTWAEYENQRDLAEVGRKAAEKAREEAQAVNARRRKGFEQRLTALFPEVGIGTSWDFSRFGYHDVTFDEYDRKERCLVSFEFLNLLLLRAEGEES